MTTSRLVWSVLLGALLAHGPAAGAPQEIYLCVDGAEGNVTTVGFVGCGNVISYTGAFQRGEPRCQVGLVKEFDGISVPLALAALGEGTSPELRVYFVQTGEVVRTTLQVTLSEFLVTGISATGETGDADLSLADKVLLVPGAGASVEVTSQAYDELGVPLPAVTTLFDCGAS